MGSLDGKNVYKIEVSEKKVTRLQDPEKRTNFPETWELRFSTRKGAPEAIQSFAPLKF